VAKKDKIVNEIKAEREEILQQLVDNVKKERKRLIEAETEKLREENRLLRQQISNPEKDKLIFYSNDADPNAQMVWISLLEKKGVPFENIFVNYYNKDLNQTKEFLAINPQGTVPAGVHRGINLTNAYDMCWYIDEAFPEPPLSPEDSVAKYKMRAFIERHKPLNALWWSLLTELDTKKRPTVAKNLDAAIKAFDEDIVGPFIMGQMFTLADVFYLPVFERIDVVLGHYRDFQVPAECERVIHWLKDCHNRQSFKTTTERTEASLNVLPWSETHRSAYLREVYEAHTVGRWSEIQLALSKTSKPLTPEERKKIIYPQSTSQQV